MTYSEPEKKNINFTASKNISRMYLKSKSGADIFQIFHGKDTAEIHAGEWIGDLSFKFILLMDKALALVWCQ
jgi:hypothetical protein